MEGFFIRRKGVHTYTHTRTHARTHARTHTHRHAQTHTHTRTHTHTHTNILIHPDTHTPTYAPRTCTVCKSSFRRIRRRARWSSTPSLLKREMTRYAPWLRRSTNTKHTDGHNSTDCLADMGRVAVQQNHKLGRAQLAQIMEKVSASWPL